MNSSPFVSRTGGHSERLRGKFWTAEKSLQELHIETTGVYPCSSEYALQTYSLQFGGTRVSSGWPVVTLHVLAMWQLQSSGRAGQVHKVEQPGNGHLTSHEPAGTTRTAACVCAKCCWPGKGSCRGTKTLLFPSSRGLAWLLGMDELDFSQCGPLLSPNIQWALESRASRPWLKTVWLTRCTEGI